MRVTVRVGEYSGEFRGLSIARCGMKATRIPLPLGKYELSERPGRRGWVALVCVHRFGRNGVVDFASQHGNERFLICPVAYEFFRRRGVIGQGLFLYPKELDAGA